jgi:non-ribosomal peptide synthase protein (TIGR01720 family)
MGWLTAISPVLLELDPREADPGQHLRSVKEQLRAVPRAGIGYGLLRYLGGGDAAARLAALPAAEVLFNYLGQLDLGLPAGSLFAPAAEPTAAPWSPRQRRSHLLEINGVVAGGRLRTVWTYSESRHDRRTVQALADRFVAALHALVERCRAEVEAVFTPSDFPEAELSQEDLDTLMASLGKGRPGGAAAR